MATKKATQVVHEPPLGTVVQNAADFTVEDILLQPGDIPMKQVTDAGGRVVAILSADDYATQYVDES